MPQSPFVLGDTLRIYTYYAVLFDEEASVVAPDALFRSSEDGVRLERLDREHGGWVDDPALFDFFRGEPGAEPVDEDQAGRIVRSWGFEGSVVAGRLPG